MTELTRFAHDEHGHTYPDELGDYYLVDETQKLIATLREQLEARDGEIARLRNALALARGLINRDGAAATLAIIETALSTTGGK